MNNEKTFRKLFKFCFKYVIGISLVIYLIGRVIVTYIYSEKYGSLQCVGVDSWWECNILDIVLLSLFNYVKFFISYLLPFIVLLGILYHFEVNKRGSIILRSFLVGLFFSLSISGFLFSK